MTQTLESREAAPLRLQRGEWWLWFAGMLLLVIFAAQIRYAGINSRPMHADEAVHAYKLQDLLKGDYRYDPNDYHGPTLYYFTLPILQAKGTWKVADFTQAELRLVPLFFGVALIPLVLLLKSALGRIATAVAALLLAVSPALVFYSTYYIQEMLLLFFTLAALGCGWQFLRTRGTRRGWALAAAANIALMAATKETWILTAFATVAGLLAARYFPLRPPASAVPIPSAAPSNRTRFHLITLALSFALFAFLWLTVLTVGFTKMSGALDGLRTFARYIGRADNVTDHHHPWYYYLQILTWWKTGPGPTWSEGLIVPLALLGLIAALTGLGIAPARRRFALFLAAFTLVLTAEYAVISYKTPWCLLSFLLGMILLAGIGVSALVRLLRPFLPAAAVLALALAFGLYKLDETARLANSRFASNNFNPYVCSGTLKGVEDLESYIATLQQINPALRVQVVDRGETWPLLWYIRKAGRIGFTPLLPPADASGADVWILQQKQAEQIESQENPDGSLVYEKFQDNTVPDFYPLRPNFAMVVYTNRALFSKFQDVIATRPAKPKPKASK